MSRRSLRMRPEMRVAVTGATGHVGSNLVRALIERGDQVRVLVRGRGEQLAGLELERVAGDLEDVDALRRAFAGVEVVFHLAAKISISGDPQGHVRSTNVDGTRRVAEAALAAGVRRMVHCSSVHAFDLYVPGQGPEPLVDESWPRVPDAAPHFAYDRSKAAGERALREVMALGLEAVIVHPSGVIGPHDHGPSRMGRVFLELYHRSLPSLVDGGFDFVDVRDVVAGMLVAAERGQPGANYILNGHDHRVAGLARLAEQVTGVRAPRITAPIRALRLGVPVVEAIGRVLRKEPLYTRESLAVLDTGKRFSHARAQRELGYAPRPTLDTVRDIYAWFEQAGMLRRKR
jgi:dihydroflavonol-4-reductase